MLELLNIVNMPVLKTKKFELDFTGADLTKYNTNAKLAVAIGESLKNTNAKETINNVTSSVVNMSANYGISFKLGLWNGTYTPYTLENIRGFGNTTANFKTAVLFSYGLVPFPTRIQIKCLNVDAYERQNAFRIYAVPETLDKWGQRQVIFDYLDTRHNVGADSGFEGYGVANHTTILKNKTVGQSTFDIDLKDYSDSSYWNGVSLNQKFHILVVNANQCSEGSTNPFYINKLVIE